jgi:hypothetical protein
MSAAIAADAALRDRRRRLRGPLSWQLLKYLLRNVSQQQSTVSVRQTLGRFKRRFKSANSNPIIKCLCERWIMHF